jgi:hypothetical protein
MPGYMQALLSLVKHILMIRSELFAIGQTNTKCSGPNLLLKYYTQTFSYKEWYTLLYTQKCIRKSTIEVKKS